MCGIAGFTHRNREVSSSRIREATASLAHRGPDQQGVFESRQISLGAVRLKIIDLVAGEQPMHSEDGDTVLVFNGEIYNHPALRDELQKLGHQFTSRSDTEVVLRAFLQWDTECFPRFRGMFGLAIWRESQKRLVLARDRVGIKPLYFYRKGSELYFASELKAILRHPEVKRVINLDGLNCYLRLNYIPAPHTLVQGIDKLAPGHLLIWQDGAMRMEPYWRLEVPQGAAKPPSLEAAKEKLDYLLRDSVREHLISDVPLGVWASGGLDSSTILHYAAQAASRRLKTFSITFNGRSFDEGTYSREVATRYGTDHSEFDLNVGVDLPGAIQELAYYSDEPSADAGSLPVWFLAKMSSQDVTVALNGEGADELFGGYLTYQADRYARVARRVPAPLRRAALAGLRHWPVSDEKISFEYKLRRFLRGSLLPADAAHLYWNGTFSDDELAGFFVHATPAPMREMLRNVPDTPGFNRYLLFDQLYYLPDDILHKADRMGMAHSFEVRPPFLDHRIVEFAASLPPHYKIRGRKLKFLLHELMKDKLPPFILRRKKIGFDIPAHEWFRGVLKPLLLDTLTESAVRESNLFHWHGIRSVIRQHLKRRASFGYHLWGLLILFLWMKRWNIQTTGVSPESREMTEGILTLS